MLAFLKSHRYLSIGIGLVVLFIFLRKNASFMAFLDVKKKEGSKFWGSIASVLGVGVAAALGILFYQGFDLVSLFGSAGVILGGALMPFRGVTDLFSRSNVIIETGLSLGTSSGERVFKIEPSALVDNGDPIKARGIIINLKFQVSSSTASPGDGVFERFFGKLLQYVEIWTPLLGTLVDRQYARGPVLYHVAEPVGLGYRKLTPRIDRFSVSSGSNPTITVPFYVPFGTEVIREPLDSYPWVGFLGGGEVKINAGAADCLREYESNVTVASMSCSAHLVTCVDRRPQRWQIPGIFSMSTYYVTASSGQKQLDFDIGSSAPNCTDASRGERVVFACLQSNRSGLSGPDNFRGLSRVGCPSLGIADTLVPDAHVTALCLATGEEGVRRQLGPGRTELTDPSGADGLFFEPAFYNDPVSGGDSDVDEGPGGTKLRVLPIFAAGKGQKLSQLPVLRPGKLQINIEKTSMPSSGQWALTMLSMRDVRKEKHEDFIRLAGATAVIDRGTENGKSALKPILDGKIDRDYFVGMPFQLKR